MTQLYFPETNSSFHNHITSIDYFFTIEQDRWNFTSNVSDAKVIPVSLLQFAENPNLLNSLHEDQVVLVWIIETCSDHLIPKQVRDLAHQSKSYGKHKKTLFVHTNYLDNSDPHYIHNDIMFNREKLYFTDYTEERCFEKHWTNRLPKSVYTVSDINKTFSMKSRAFLVPNRVNYQSSYNPWNFNNTKLKLQSFMHSIKANMYISDPHNGIILKTNGWDEDFIPSSINLTSGGHFSPLADFYYNTSYVTVAIESLYISNEIFYPSEKYFDTFIKGNFPLIFASPNAISNLKKYYGFKFPDWIDYTYDTMEELEERFSSYLESIGKLAAMPIDELHSLYLRDKHILEHNRQVFFNKPYDSLYEKVNNAISILNW